MKTQALKIRKRFDYLFLLFVLEIAVSCTQQQTQMATFDGQLNSALAPMMLQHQCSVTYQGKVTTIDQMAISGNSLFLTGQPFGLSDWNDADICDMPGSSLLFASAQQVDTFSPINSYLESWVEGNEATNALAITPGAQFVFSSGRLGSSTISVGDISNPQVAEQFPRPDPSSGAPNRDENFMYTAVAVNPTKNMMYGFRKSDYAFTLSASMPEVTIQGTTSYSSWLSGGNTCCVTNAAVFSSQATNKVNTKVFLSFGSSLLVLDIDPSSGLLMNPKQYPAIQAVNVVSTPNHLYVQHQASYQYSSGAAIASGIYVFDTSGKNVAYLDVSPMRFAVSYDDQQLFTYQTDAGNAGAVQIYRILWTNQQ